MCVTQHASNSLTKRRESDPLTNSHQDIDTLEYSRSLEHQEEESTDSQRISELFRHYADRVDQNFPVEVMKRWHQSSEFPLTLADVVGCVGGVFAQAIAVDRRREVALLEADDVIVKIVILNGAVIYVDLSTREPAKTEATMAEISENLSALVRQSSKEEC